MTADHPTPLIYPLTATAAVALLAAVNWTLDPADLVRFAVAGLILPVMWALVELIFRNRRGLKQIRGSVVLAAALLILTLGFSAADAAGLLGDGGNDITRRAFGIGVGLMLAVIGNFIPKHLEPLFEQTCAPGYQARLQRFAGWVFVIGGLGYAGSWVILPEATADIVSTVFCVTAIVLVLGRWLLISATRGKQ